MTTTDTFKDIEKLEFDLWEAADNLRANSKLTSSDYFMPVLGVIFLRHAANRFDAAHRQIEADRASGKMPKRKVLPADYIARRSLYLPEKARYDWIMQQAAASGADLPKLVTEAMTAIESEFEPLVGVLPKDYAIFETKVLEDLMRLFNSEQIKQATGDVFGRIYEYFLAKFSIQKAHDNGEFFTLSSIVQTIVNVIEPDHGTVFDPACGSGGMFVQSSHFIEHEGSDTAKKVVFYDQEADATVNVIGASASTGRHAVELCAGLGGIGLGLRSLGFTVVRAYDSWEAAVATYNHNFPGESAAKCNLATSAGFTAVKDGCREYKDIDLLAAGPPCKGFSQLRNGRHDGRNGHNRLLAAMPGYVAVLRPRLFLIENVPDLLRHRHGRTFASLLKDLRHPARGLRYTVEHHIYDAAAFGTPQARRRLLILGVRTGSGNEHLPTPGPDLAPLFAALRHGGPIPAHLVGYVELFRDPDDDRYITAAQALSDLPLLDAGQPDGLREYADEAQSAFQRWARQGAPAKLSDTRTPRVNEETVRRLLHIPPGGCARAIPKEQLNGLSRRYDSAYRRLHPDVPSTALSTKYDCVYHYARAGSLSVREYARLQGIPDRVTFPGSLACRRSAYEMIGNSVPPRLIVGVMAEALRMGSAAGSRSRLPRSGRS